MILRTTSADAHSTTTAHITNTHVYIHTTICIETRLRLARVSALTSCTGGRPPQYAHASHATLTFDLLTLKVVSELRVTWAKSVPILVFLGFSVLDLGPMYATDVRQTEVRRTSSLNAPLEGA